MAQNPFLIDQLQIEPGSTGTRLIRRKTTDNSLEFSDGVVGALSLKMLAGINITGLLTVGPGAGAQFTTIQDAINSLPVGSVPYTILVYPGTYAETVTLQRTNVTLVGVGFPTIVQSTGSTFIIQAGGGSTPYRVTVQGFDFDNSDVAASCVRLIGGAGSDVGRDGIELIDCNLEHDAGGGKTLWATSVCKVFLHRCSMGVNDSIATIANCGEVKFYDIDGLAGYEFSYDSTGTLPSLTTGDYGIFRAVVGPSLLTPILSADLSGGGAFLLADSQVSGDVTLAGNQSVLLLGSWVGGLIINDTAAVILSNSNRGSVTAAVGVTLAENIQQGVVSFVGVTFKAVVFGAKQPDTDYVIGLEPNNYGTYISARSATGFTVTASGVTTADVPYTITRVI